MSDLSHLWAAQRRAHRLRIGAWVLGCLLGVGAFIGGCLWLGDQLDVLGTNAVKVTEQVAKDPEGLQVDPQEQRIAQFLIGH